LVTSINELKRQGRKRRKERQNVKEIILQSPENGLLVQKLIPVAKQVYAARSEVLYSVSRLVNFIVIYSCRYFYYFVVKSLIKCYRAYEARTLLR